MKGTESPRLDGFDTTPLHTDFGLEVEFDTPDLESVARVVRAAVSTARLVRIRALALDEDGQLKLTALLGSVVGQRRGRLGRLEPNVRYEAGADRFADRWHADQSWAAATPWTLLSCVSVDETADDTQFVDTSSALRRMDPALLRGIEQATVAHDVSNSRRLRPAAGPPSVSHRTLARRTSHAVVRRVGVSIARFHSEPTLVEPNRSSPLGTHHPLIDHCRSTGARHLRIGDHAWLIDGLSEAESTKRLDALHAALDHPSNVLTLGWMPGDTVVFDNRVVLHRRAAEHARAGRVLRRTMSVVH